MATLGDYVKKLIEKYKRHYSGAPMITSTVTGLALFAASLFISDAATLFATERAGNNVTDLIISNIPVFNVDFIVNEIALLFSLFILVAVLLNPKTMPFVLKSAALLIIIRSLFIMLTHLGPFPERTFIDQTEIFSSFNIGNDFFFSNHTALPFLMALIFWNENKFVRRVSLAASGVFGISVLLGHLHYSIDVFAAFFITYSIFHLAQKFFSKDYALFKSIDAE